MTKDGKLSKRDMNALNRAYAILSDKLISLADQLRGMAERMKDHGGR